MSAPSSRAHCESTLFESYAAACRTGAEVEGGDGGDGAAFEEGVERVKEHLLSASGDGAICMVCLENIRPTDSVWSCQDGCYAVLHLPCVQSWARRTLAMVQEKAEQRLDPRLFPAAAAEARRTAAWGCPKCRQDYEAVPGGYTCWCGKVANPDFNPWGTAHSCGEHCERPAPSCEHPCMLLCHPGPCPPCPRVISTSCFCGALVTDKRCGHHEFSCGGTCYALLPCGHTCPAICHDGGCPPCGELVSTVSCLCGAEVAQLPCSQQELFKCPRVCGKLLDCGRHHCEEVCHAGTCGPCKLAGPKACPCAKTQLADAACDVVVGPCGETCGKLLICGVHTCHERCHAGPCTTVCREQVKKRCECGQTERVVQCHESFKCERRCEKMRSCERHPCRRRCCVACPPCEEVCKRWLKCRNHRCPAPCHSGECAPCPLSARISCACGKTHYSVPCGRESTAKPPPCRQPCPVPSLCRHAAAQPPHCCHFGPCPPCTVPACGTQLACGHACSLLHCHDPPPPATPEYQPPPPPVSPVVLALPGSASGSGSSSSSSSKQQQPERQLPPAQATAAAARRLQNTMPRTPEGQLSSCLPCPIPVPVTCFGGHITVQVACNSAAPFACQQPCGRKLECGNHTCSLTCHDDAQQQCAYCTLPCQRPRDTCEHACPLPCHPASQACPACLVGIRVPCHCGRTTLEFSCCEINAAAPSARLNCGKTCHRELPGCPHTCELECHAGTCTSVGCAKEVTVRCACKRNKRKLACAEVQRLLLAATGSGTYDDTTSLRLLICDDGCAKAAATEAAAAPAAAKGSGDVPGAPLTPPMATKASTAAAEAPKRKMTREEKQRERELARQQKDAEERRKQIVHGLVFGVLLCIAVLLALFLRHLALVVDRKAQEAWRPEL
ncbi:hypothetical protein CHLNCDRAFT_34551 [Chlorella variabilis]|uniref:NF-X1-type domain-containing protein n=1 Tax=Chlorella variabilis TaxID=554065 RepID=E1Z771_CHLVA|nr:hypothetical protein CHLNCDRAFT_34551 [Chlorella variabilis]EFN58119.1 hypothetical protein CHLNCDRAFT_34551 [Chlorella variabilis]|eukprot:XP_005850221.1 hypothetical protein CHLNCDRAFT_34551 [Chlorella variabilis]